MANFKFDFRNRSSRNGLGILFLAFIVLSISRLSIASPESPVSCDIHKGPCTQPLRDRNITLEILPRPVKAMQDLIFRVTFSGEKPPKSPFIDLGMPGMIMGPNRVLLTLSDDGSYEGKGVIVRCPSGRKTWFADVTLPESGVIRFIFDVVY